MNSEAGMVLSMFMPNIRPSGTVASAGKPPGARAAPTRNEVAIISELDDIHSAWHDERRKILRFICAQKAAGGGEGEGGAGRLHVSAVFPADGEHGIGDLAEGAAADGVH